MLIQFEVSYPSDSYNRNIWINPEHVKVVKMEGYETTKIFLLEWNDPIKVEGNLEEVVDKINKACRKEIRYFIDEEDNRLKKVEE